MESYQKKYININVKEKYLPTFCRPKIILQAQASKGIYLIKAIHIISKIMHTYVKKSQKTAKTLLLKIMAHTKYRQNTTIKKKKYVQIL